MSAKSRGVKRASMAAFLLAAAIGFAALGLWQVHRRAWKLELLAAVDRRVRAAPVAAPEPAEWDAISAGRDAYRHVRLRGVFRNDRETLVQALTDRGPGFWVLTPLRTDAGWTVLVNRGFVPDDRRDSRRRGAPSPAGDQIVTGLLRITEPKGSFLHANDPVTGRWYSRDVAAIARDRRLGPVAPYFVDAGAAPDPAAYPVGGLTVIAFPNNHLAYALTWFALAGMSLFGLFRLARDAGAGMGQGRS